MVFVRPLAAPRSRAKGSAAPLLPPKRSEIGALMADQGLASGMDEDWIPHGLRQTCEGGLTQAG